MTSDCHQVRLLRRGPFGLPRARRSRSRAHQDAWPLHDPSQGGPVAL